MGDLEGDTRESKTFKGLRWIVDSATLDNLTDDTFERD